MNKKQQLVILGSVVAGISIIAFAYIRRGQTTTLRPYTIDEIKVSDGKNGNDCFVAVDGFVYDINQGKKWNDGKHDPSQGQAYCGADLTDVIDKSPHGRSMLSVLTKIGTLSKND